jgi:hypothetical protein
MMGRIMNNEIEGMQKEGVVHYYTIAAFTWRDCGKLRKISGQPVIGQRLKPENSRIRSRSANHSAAMFVGGGSD